jgi:diguanylate cyclase (GGDEF)-like protein/PAS domain S-box-containing protein
MNSTASCGSSDSRPTSRFQSLSDPDNLREFARNLREGIYISTRDGRILDANPAFLEMYGVASLAELQGLSGDDLVANPARHLEQLALIDRFGFVREFEVMILRPDGGVRTALNTCYLTSDPSTGEEFVHGILIDITARKALEAKLFEMSTHDALTGALNRRHLIDVEEAFARDPNTQYGCIFIDIDQFKLYNDTHGHQKGDEVLVHMARFLMRHIRAEESVIRIGGDEFVVLLAGADLGATQLVADRFRAEALRTAPVPFSIGCAAREPGESLPHLIDRADLGLMAVRVERRLSDPRGRGALDPV